MVASTKLYDTLGVEPTANEADIKRAFKRTALRLHPDKTNNDPACAEKFREATEAYEVLGDAERRRAYDQFGVTEDVGGGPNHPPDMSDIFGGIFGGGGGGPFAHMFRQQQQHQHQQQRRTDGANVQLSLVEVFAGGVKHFTVEMLDACASCNGNGVADASDIIACARCGGNGVTMSQVGPFVAQMTCQSCFGKGKMIRPGKACATCSGNKVAPSKKTFDVRLPRGILNGHTHTIASKGAYNPEDRTHNDIRLTFVYVLPEEVVRIAPDNSEVVLLVRPTLQELLAGFERVLTPWGQKVSIKSTKYFDPSKEVRIPGKGMPRHKSKSGSIGDLVLRFEVAFPPSSMPPVMAASDGDSTDDGVLKKKKR